MNVHITKCGQGKPLVLFHGWGFDHQIWNILIPYLEHDYQLFLVDLPGFGLTPDMEWTEFASLLLDKLPQQFALAGWSMGGLYATRVALEFPYRVQALINICSSPYFQADALWPGVNPAVLNGFYQKIAIDPQATLHEFINLQTQRVTCNIPLGHPPSTAGLQRGLTILATWDLRTQLGHLTMPNSYFFGRLDAITSTKVMRALQGRHPEFRYVLFRKAAHMPFMSHTDEFIAQLKECIR